MAVARVVHAPGVDPARFADIVGRVESHSNHPIARAVVGHFADQVSSRAEVSEVRESPGRGVQALVDGSSVYLGRASGMPDDVVAPEEIKRAIEAAENDGHSTVVAVVDGRVWGVVSVTDTLRPDAAETIAVLHRMGLKVVMCSGDSLAAATAVANTLGIDRVWAGVTPEGKVDVVRSLQAEGHRVAMVGDGVNDAPALATANVGIALGAGTDQAIAASDITLTRGGLADVPVALRLARKTLGTIRGNLFWAFAYNTVAIPAAMAGLLSPLLAGAAMAFSSVFVVTNSLRLTRFRATTGRRARR